MEKLAQHPSTPSTQRTICRISKPMHLDMIPMLLEISTHKAPLFEIRW